MAPWPIGPRITGIVVSGAVGPGLGAWYVSRHAAREHEYARVLADRAELRTLLDTAEQVIRRLGRMGGAMQGLFLRHGRWTKERAAEHFDQFREVGREADLQAGRLALRLGREHPVAKACPDAFEAVIKIDTALEVFAAEGEHADLRVAHEAMTRSDGV